MNVVLSAPTNIGEFSPVWELLHMSGFYAAQIQVCYPSSSKKRSRETKTWLDKFFTALQTLHIKGELSVSNSRFHYMLTETIKDIEQVQLFKKNVRI